jgi:hypothetical protein
MSMGDFNNDNRVDFVIANEGTDSIGIFIAFNYTIFQSGNTYSDENNQAPNAVIVNDFNNDNYIDIAVVFTNTNNLSILLGYGNGSFTDMINYSTGINSLSYALAASDFNNDGQLDIVVANSGTNNVGIFLGYGNGSFATMITSSTGVGSTPRSLAVADFNNDNRTDIVSANSGTNNIGILLGYGNGSFGMVMIRSTGDYSTPYGVAVGDFNNDGRLDIVVVNFGTSTVGIFLGYGDGNFETPVTYSTGFQSNPWSVVIGDFNNDNQSDIATANFNANNVGILLGYGNGSFVTMVKYSSGDGSYPVCVRVGDFNNDNKSDVAVANYGSNDFVVLFGFGDGTFLSGSTYSTGTGSLPMSLAIADFNNDTRLDIVVANSRSNNLLIFLGYRYQPYAGVTIYSTGNGSAPHSVAIADFNNDGWSDIIVANYGTNNFGIFLGYGTKGFGSMITYSTRINSSPYSVAIADFNSDNQSDVVITNSNSDSIAIFLGFSNGTFAMGAIYSTGDRSRPYGVAIGDLNNDKISDIVIANSGTSIILVFYGYGNGTFGNETSYKLGYEYYPYSVAITDLNQDNWMDIVIACYGTNHIETLVKMC